MGALRLWPEADGEDTLIRVTVELLPFGSEQERETLGQINIVNDVTGDLDVGNYDVTLVKHGRVVQHVRVLDHRRNDGWGELLRRVLGEGLAQQ